MLELTQVLQEATQAIAPVYFQLPVQASSPKYRERVYCYELYHQIRCRWPPFSKFTLNGEVDKRSHPILRDLLIDERCPDFLVHTPGFMSGNHAIIEVKHAKQIRGIEKDLNTLTDFVHKAGYQRAIYLVYGSTTHARRWHKSVSAQAKKLTHLCRIEIWTHERAWEQARCAYTIGESRI